MKTALILKKAPLSGRFFYERIFPISFALLFAGWMTFLHFPPWLSWHSEMLAFATALLMSVGLIKNRSDEGGHIPIFLPKIGWPMGLLCIVVAIQASIARIGFMGDAVVLIFYLFLCLVGLTVGYSVAVTTRNESTPFTFFVDQFAKLVVFGGATSVIVALVQTLDVWESASVIARMQTLRRPGSNLGQPNQLATLILFSIASIVYLFESRRVQAVVAFPLGALFLLGLALTESRSGVLGLLLMATWWVAKRRKIGGSLSACVVGLWLVFFGCCFVFWPTFFNLIQEGSWAGATVGQVNTSAGSRLLVWPQLVQAVLMHPWFGWGLREVSTAHNAVAHDYAVSEAFAYAHNIILDLAVGVGIPLTFLLVGAAAVWLWRRVQAVDNLLTWYCLAVALPFGVHSMLEYPFAYAYLLFPVMLLLGVLEARLASTYVVRISWKIAVAVWLLLSMAMAWSVLEYIAIEEDFRVARFEAMRMGQTPSDYERPKIVLLTQLDALLKGARILPTPGMKPDQIELARRVAMRFPWPATQNRYALSLALNGNANEALRQLRVMRVMHGEKTYNDIKASWNSVVQERYPALREIELP